MPPFTLYIGMAELKNYKPQIQPGSGKSFSGYRLPYEFCYTQTSFKQFQKLQCFLSNTTNNMHILASGPEQQAVYSGHLIHPSYSILPPCHQEVKQIYYETRVYTSHTWLWVFKKYLYHIRNTFEMYSIWSLHPNITIYIHQRRTNIAKPQKHRIFGRFLK